MLQRYFKNTLQEGCIFLTIFIYWKHVASFFQVMMDIEYHDIDIRIKDI